jgi:hypothetical protein
MLRLLTTLCLSAALLPSSVGCGSARSALEGRPAPNTLSHKEKEAGWEMLFDGETLTGWRGFQRDSVPEGWAIVDGSITLVGRSGDLITTQQFRDFELRLQWKISSGGNSGIFFRVTEDHGAVYETGPEMQVLHNLMHPDGKNPLTSAGSNYGLYAPSEDRTRTIGVWNDVILRVQDNHVQHWLNGTLIVDYELMSPEWEALVAASKFAQWPDYGRALEGHIALQDHGDPVRYRDIKLLRLY